uniref:phosphoinositide phospholipase C 2-like n=1 Tax=Erigeron canadensis TaxID=72917 RepID=UPI001CB8ADEC|nr:phosphoinositide phospholipase C 2-like [Erigeron canadensis]
MVAYCNFSGPSTSGKSPSMARLNPKFLDPLLCGFDVAIINLLQKLRVKTSKVQLHLFAHGRVMVMKRVSWDTMMKQGPLHFAPTSAQYPCYNAIKTLKAPVTLDKCLEAIKTCVFVASNYPVILTLEDRLTPDLQAKVAKMVTETFGNVLYKYTGSDLMKDFPSPESLKRRIVVSTKPPKEYLDTPRSTTGQNESSLNVKASSEEDDENKDEDFQDEEEIVKQNVESEYKQLIAIHAKKLNGGVKDWLQDDPTAAKRISLRETRLEKAIENHAKDVIRFTQRNLLRIFPKGSRVDSSNYNPLVGWTHGAQMVAFNMQTHGRSLWLMQGLFRANGGCGYVKKPDLYLKNGPDDKIFEPKSTRPVKKTLKVKEYMGDGWHLDFKRTHFDIYSPPDFYVKVGIAGVHADSTMKKTKIIQDAWTPKWEEEFEFPLTVPELALLRVEVHEYDMTEKDDFGGQTCLPVFELRSGIRAVPLHDQKGDKYKSVKLLMRFEFL